MCGLDFDGHVYCWGGSGSANPTLVATVPDAVQVAGNVNVKCVLTSAGKVFCWGAYYVGNGSSGAVTSPIEITGLGNVTELTAGNMMMCVRNDELKVYCWGYTYVIPPSPMYLAPVEVMDLRGAIRVAASVNYICAVLDDGSVKCLSQAGAYKVAGLSGVTEIKSGGNAISGFCVLDSNSALKCFGTNGSSDTTLISTPGLGPVKYFDVSSGKAFCAVQVDDVTKCWGSNAYRQIDSSNTTEFVNATTVTNRIFTEIRTADTFTCGLTEKNSLVCWGSGNTFTP